jgi:hypothetical protein
MHTSFEAQVMGLLTREGYDKGPAGRCDRLGVIPLATVSECNRVGPTLTDLQVICGLFESVSKFGMWSSRKAYPVVEVDCFPIRVIPYGLFSICCPCLSMLNAYSPG